MTKKKPRLVRTRRGTRQEPTPSSPFLSLRPRGSWIVGQPRVAATGGRRAVACATPADPAPGRRVTGAPTATRFRPAHPAGHSLVRGERGSGRRRRATPRRLDVARVRGTRRSRRATLRLDWSPRPGATPRCACPPPTRRASAASSRSGPARPGPRPPRRSVQPRGRQTRRGRKASRVSASEQCPSSSPPHPLQPARPHSHGSQSPSQGPRTSRDTAARSRLRHAADSRLIDDASEKRVCRDRKTRPTPVPGARASDARPRVLPGARAPARTRPVGTDPAPRDAEPRPARRRDPRRTNPALARGQPAPARPATAPRPEPPREGAIPRALGVILKIEGRNDGSAAWVGPRSRRNPVATCGLVVVVLLVVLTLSVSAPPTLCLLGACRTGSRRPWRPRWVRGTWSP